MTGCAPLRVAHVGTYRRESADGTDKTILGLSALLPRHGVQVEVWEPVRGGSSLSDHEQDGVRIWDLPVHPLPAAYARALPAETRQFVRSRQSQVDMVHFHSGFIPEFASIAAQLRVPYVVTPNGVYSPANLRGRNWWFKQGWVLLRDKPMIRRARLLVAVSEGECHELGRLFPGVRLIVIPNAVDVPPLPSVTIGRDFVFLGRMAVEQKGLDVLVQGYRTFLDRSGDQTTRLLLVGPDYRGGQQQLEEHIRTLRLGSRVEIRPAAFGADKWALLAGALALTHPSRWDGLPFTVLEALAAGRPVLITPATNLGELVDSHAAGVLIHSSADDVAAGLARLLAMSEADRARMGTNGQRLVRDNFSWPQAAARMAQAYHEIATKFELNGEALSCAF